jgi:predicted dithiol-disulfide oxidoreductase (DUF899 family)
MDPTIPLTGPDGPVTLLDAFEGRRQLIAYYFMWWPGHPAADESARYRDFMGWDMPWYSAHASLDALLGDRELGLFHLVCYLREEMRVFETYWTRRRGVEAMDYSYALMDLTVYGRQESWEDSPPGWPQQCTGTRTNGGAPDWPPVPAGEDGRPIAQWPRLAAGHPEPH